MKRLIIKRDYFFPTNVAKKGIYGSVRLTFTCGHYTHKKISQEPKSYCICKECNKK